MSVQKKLITKTKGNLYYLHWESGGELPKELQGMYTSQKTALAAGDSYIAKRGKNAKNKPREK